MSDPQHPTKRPLAESLERIRGVAHEQAAALRPDDALAASIELIFIEIDGLKSAQQRASEEHDLRKQYLPKLFWLTVAWLGVVVGFVLATSLKWITLSDSVLIAFITSTTVSVLGLFILAAQWLFASSRKPEAEKKS